MESAQRELNPHFRHGKAAGCRYIMGAFVVCRIVKEPLLSPLSYALEVGPKGFEPLLAGLKVRCAAVTPRPRMKVGRMRFKSLCCMVVLLCS